MMSVVLYTLGLIACAAIIVAISYLNTHEKFYAEVAATVVAGVYAVLGATAHGDTMTTFIVAAVVVIAAVGCKVAFDQHGNSRTSKYVA